MRIVMLGLSITSSWGNGHATTYRGLVRELVRRGHDVLFLERDVPWYASNRDMPRPPYGRTELYSDLADLKDRFTDAVRGADLVVVGSYVPQGVEVGAWVQRTARGVSAFYDIDTPVTLAKLTRAGYSPSVRLFEAAACAVPIISDAWEGLDTFFRPGEEILISRSGEETRRYLQEVPDAERQEMGRKARARVLAAHTAAHRAETLEDYTRSVSSGRKP
ncbi:hypothetical protein CYFUS_009174 [Cystobacter fuscus]|uniref:Spore protein YkvP/CgeB glycosyl transferase-like domain-containing protein n=1 Tax=Cystobacter fuscus TaxID=43 RepID=A0A250JIH0_9BACT|nr:glycosyltransferase [Cystobacter fuscus]ATB43694.1 hypothetical protein CYFUS_009174 [Cystobacter fuscus]